MALKVRSFRSQPDDAAFHTLLSAGPKAAIGPCDAAGVMSMATAGLSWLEILQLVWEYGPLITQIATTVINALKSSGGVTLTLIQQLVSQYGKPVEDMIKALLAKLGIVFPAPVP